MSGAETWPSRPLATRPFAVDDLHCPECGQLSVIGLLLCDEQGRHMHTFYVCTFWRSGLTANRMAAHRHCGWTGWSVPGWDNA